MNSPQVPAEQRTQRLWCVECFKLEHLDIDDVPEELGWHEGRCPDCAEREADVPLSDTPVQEAAAP